MKKINVFVCLLFSVSMLTSCSSDGAVETSDGANTKKVDDCLVTYTENIPCTIEYNENDISLIYAGIYESQENYEYGLHCMAVLDIGDLTEKEIHYIEEDLSFSPMLEFDSEKYDYTNLNKDISKIYGKYYIFNWSLADSKGLITSRDPYENGNISFALNVPYQTDDDPEIKSRSLHYSMNLSAKKEYDTMLTDKEKYMIDN